MSTGIGAGISPVFELKPGGGAPAGWSDKYSCQFIAADSSYAQLVSTPLLGTGGTGSWTLSFWINFDAVGTGSNQRIIDWGHSGQRLQIYLSGTSFITTSGAIGGSSTYPLAAATWYNIIIRYEFGGGSGNFGFVINGTNIKNLTRTGPTFTTVGTTWMGKNSSGGYLNGFVDEVTLFTTYLSDAECIQLYNGGAPLDPNETYIPPQLQEYWRMGDPNGPSSYPNLESYFGSNGWYMAAMTSANIQTNVPT